GRRPRRSACESPGGCGSRPAICCSACYGPNTPIGPRRRSSKKRHGGWLMEPADLLRHACDVLDRLRLTYLVTGSTATIAYGEPRFTNDIDIVLDLRLDQVADFCAGFPDDEFYINPTAVS